MIPSPSPIRNGSYSFRPKNRIENADMKVGIQACTSSLHMSNRFSLSLPLPL